MTTYLRPLMAWLFMLGGWLLTAAGVYGFLVSFSLLAAEQYIEMIAATVISIFIFRGGLQILKIGVAARICQQAYADAEKAKQRPLRPRSHEFVKPPVDW